MISTSTYLQDEFWICFCHPGISISFLEIGYLFGSKLCYFSQHPQVFGAGVSWLPFRLGNLIFFPWGPFFFTHRWNDSLYTISFPAFVFEKNTFPHRIESHGQQMFVERHLTGEYIRNSGVEKKLSGWMRNRMRYTWDAESCGYLDFFIELLNTQKQGPAFLGKPTNVWLWLTGWDQGTTYQLLLLSLFRGAKKTLPKQVM